MILVIKLNSILKIGKSVYKSAVKRQRGQQKSYERVGSMVTIAQISRIVLPVLGTVLLAWCLFSLLRKPAKTATGVFLQNSANGDKFPLEYGENAIGRSKTCDIIFNYPTISRLHAVIAEKKKGWCITDTRSTTGTKVNGEAVKKRIYLFDSDIITLGGLTLVFCVESETPDVRVGK